MHINMLTRVLRAYTEFAYTYIKTQLLMHPLHNF